MMENILAQKRFLEEIISVYKKHGMCISHEDEHGAFEIVPLSEENLEWLRDSLHKIAWDQSVIKERGRVWFSGNFPYQYEVCIGSDGLFEASIIAVDGGDMVIGKAESLYEAQFLCEIHERGKRASSKK